jgi:cytochrome c biogenesis protein ResB
MDFASMRAVKDVMNSLWFVSMIVLMAVSFNSAAYNINKC